MGGKNYPEKEKKFKKGKKHYENSVKRRVKKSFKHFKKQKIFSYRMILWILDIRHVTFLRCRKYLKTDQGDLMVLFHKIQTF